MKKFDKNYLKSIVLLLGTQAVFYYAIKNFVSNYHLVSIALDDKIPFLPGFIWIYDLWYPFLFICLYFLYKKDKETYMLFFFCTAIGTIIGDIIFVTYPSYVIRPDVIGEGLTKFAVRTTYHYDAPAINCFPSMHCYFCFNFIMAALLSKKIDKRFRLFIIITCILIILSTLFVKQHAIVDVIGAAVLTLLSYLIFTNKKLLNYAKKKLNKLF